MTVIVLKDITTDTNASVETLLEVLSKHIDTLADASHYFVIDPTDTTIMSTNINGVRQSAEACTKFEQILTNNFSYSLTRKQLCSQM